MLGADMSDPNANHTLMIVESPTKARTIERMLGPQYRCVATVGHLETLAELADITFDATSAEIHTQYRRIQGSAALMSRFEKLRAAIQTAGHNHVVLATDDDREGEAIAYSVMKLFDLPASTPRVVFHEVSERALRHALAHPIQMRMPRVLAQRARSVVDLMVGARLSPLAQRHLGKQFLLPPHKSKYPNEQQHLTIGRCQTATLSLVHDHAERVRQQQPEVHIRLRATCACLPNVVFHWSGPSPLASTDATSIEAFLARTIARAASYRLTASPEHLVVSPPPTPLSTAAMQQCAARDLGLAPDATMAAAQFLYDHGLITYPRTSGTHLCANFRAAATAQILGTANTTKYVPDWNPANDSAAHEAIRVTNPAVVSVPEDALADARARPSGAAFAKTLARLYAYILRHSLCACADAMCACEYSLRLEDVHDPQSVWTATAREVREIGWHRTWTQWTVAPLKPGVARYRDPAAESSENSDAEAMCPASEREQTHVDIHRRVQLLGGAATLRSQPMPTALTTVRAEETRTGHVGPLTEAQLLRAMESNGIGRPSTYAYLLDTLVQRQYIRKVAPTLWTAECTSREVEPAKSPDHPPLFTRTRCTQTFGRASGGAKTVLEITDVGRAVHEFAHAWLSPLVAVDATRAMERALDDIETGDQDWTATCRDYHATLSQMEGTLKQMAPLSSALPAAREEPGTLVDGAPRYRVRTDHWTATLHSGRFGNFAKVYWSKSPAGTEPTIVSLPATGSRPIANVRDDEVLEAVAEFCAKNQNDDGSITMPRILSPTVSVRSGPRGDYIMQQLGSGRKPVFYSLDNFTTETQLNHRTCPEDTLKAWIVYHYGNVFAKDSMVPAVTTTRPRKHRGTRSTKS